MYTPSPLSPPTPPPSNPSYVLPETTVLAIVGCVDLVSTVYLIATGQAQEANPLMAGLLTAFGPRGLVAAKFLLLAVPLAIAEIARKKKPAFVRTALRIGLLLYLMIYTVSFIRYNLSPPPPEEQEISQE
jgi:hypothetical protein